MLNTRLTCLLQTSALTMGMFLSIHSANAGQGEVVVMAWGTTWEQGLNAVADSFEKESGLKVTRVTQSGSADGLARLQAMRDAPKVDVWFSTSTLAAQAVKDQKLFAKIPTSDLKNAGDVIAGAVTSDMVAAYYYPLSIIYRPDLVKQPIATWSDLWSAKLTNSIAIPDVQTYAARMLLTANTISGGTINDVTPGLEKLKALKPNIAMFYGSDSDVRRALAQGEVSVLVGPPSQAKPLRDDGVEVKVVSPKPSAVMFDVMTLVNTPQQKDGVKFMDYVISHDAQELISRNFDMGPVNKTSAASKDLADVLPKESDQAVYDDAKVAANMGAWNEKFQAEIAH
ncbi:ABC transporter substrate-binding protein [Rhizobium rhizogenes]|uniref:ABC transporter substrate-binding protein n=1 Tax=Rhizobium rhizogenes TaxID=359 RepID=UPI00157202F9|nr:extracellular solute-binding protein [Rhizobium rhizogenes]NTH22896.1 extracellular solute-binding protein [Rhizobium rhizogenes]NTH35925.1 extracellular solute-binding protein [Rhizobium rhizogenes]